MPEPPVNVRVVTHDGAQHPVEVAYRGVDEDGNHLWVATMTWRGVPAGLNIDTLPARTAVSVEFTP